MIIKNFFALLISTLLLATAPAYAETYSIDKVDEVADFSGAEAEKFFSTLPQAKGEYKSSRRPILLEGALNIETDIFVRALKNPVAYRELNYLFVAGTYKNYPVVVVRTEQGLANAAASTALAIKKFNPVAVINQGTAGGHDPKIKIGDIIIGTKSIPLFAIKTTYTKRGEGADITNQELRGTFAYDEVTKKFQPYTEYHANTELFNMAFAVANTQKNFNVVSGVISSSDAWLNTIDYINFLHEKYGSSCEDMETAAVAQVCQNVGVPFIGIRILSDNNTIKYEYDPSVAKPCQEFVLLVAEKYIDTFLNR